MISISGVTQHNGDCNSVTHRREDDLDVQVAASGFVKQLEEMYGDPEAELDSDEDQSEESFLTMVDKIKLDDLDPETDPAPPSSSAMDPETDPEPLNHSTMNPVADPAPPNHSTMGPEADPAPTIDPEGTDRVPDLVDDLPDWPQCAKSRAAGSVSSMSTIHPDVIKQRVKKNLSRRKNDEVLSRIRAKGEASAVTRKRRENKDNIRADGIWGWDN